MSGAGPGGAARRPRGGRGMAGLRPPCAAAGAGMALALLLAAAGGAPAQEEGAERPPRIGAEAEGADAPDGPDFASPPEGPDGEPLEYRPPAPPQPDTVPADLARLRFLDKMTGQVRVIEMRPGETRVEDRLEIRLAACRVPEADSRAEAVAWLSIRDTREAEPRFAGWMFASSPALNALDHARYDVWVLSCSASSGEQSGGSE